MNRLESREVEICYPSEWQNQGWILMSRTGEGTFHRIIE